MLGLLLLPSIKGKALLVLVPSSSTGLSQQGLHKGEAQSALPGGFWEPLGPTSSVPPMRAHASHPSFPGLQRQLVPYIVQVANFLV